MHVHMAFESKGRMNLSPPDLLKGFLGSPFQLTSEQSARRRCVGWSSFYYVQAPKVGHLFHTGTKMAYEDYPVSAEWVWNVLQSKKMDEEVGRTELVKRSKCLTRHLPNLDRLIQESVALDLKAEISREEKILERVRTPFKQIPEVTALVQDLQVPRERWTFLVLDGPSHMGKTMFVMSLFGKHKTLEINCAGEADPALHEFKHQVHRCILFDEAEPEMVNKYRKLFQAPSARGELSRSIGALVSSCAQLSHLSWMQLLQVGMRLACCRLASGSRSVFSCRLLRLAKRQSLCHRF